MLSLEKIFISLIDQQSQRDSDGVGLIRRRSRRIQRSLRLIDAAQGGCWTAPCSPAVPAFMEEAQIIHDACYTQVQSWHNPPLLPVRSEVLKFPKIGDLTG